jgi:hypothetical protein
MLALDKRNAPECMLLLHADHNPVQKERTFVSAKLSRTFSRQDNHHRHRRATRQDTQLQKWK